MIRHVENKPTKYRVEIDNIYGFINNEMGIPVSSPKCVELSRFARRLFAAVHQ